MWRCFYHVDASRLISIVATWVKTTVYFLMPSLSRFRFLSLWSRFSHKAEPPANDSNVVSKARVPPPWWRSRKRNGQNRRGRADFRTTPEENLFCVVALRQVSLRLPECCVCACSSCVAITGRRTGRPGFMAREGLNGVSCWGNTTEALQAYFPRRPAMMPPDPGALAGKHDNSRGFFFLKLLFFFK